MKENTGQVLVQAPTEIANYLLNEKRRALGEIEQRHDAPIVIVADDQLETPHYEVTRIRENELTEETSKPSYQRGTPRKLATHALTKAHLNIPNLPAVTNVRPAQPAPVREEPREEAPAPVAAPAPIAPVAASGGFTGWLKRLFAAPAPAPAPAPSRTGDDRGRTGREARRDRDQRGRGQQQGRDGRRDEARRERGQKGPRAEGQQPQQQKQAAQQAQQPPKQPKQPQQQKPPRDPEAERAEQLRREQQRLESQQRNEQKQRERAERQAAAAAEAKSAPVADALNADAPATVVAPAVQAAVAVAEVAQAAEATASDVVRTDGAPSTDANADTGEGGGRRRRGRRGGRRRRRGQGGAEGEVATDGMAQDHEHEHDDMESGDVAAQHRSQPEFDFDDDGAPMVAISEPAPTQPAEAAAAPRQAAAHDAAFAAAPMEHDVERTPSGPDTNVESASTGYDADAVTSPGTWTAAPVANETARVDAASVEPDAIEPASVETASIEPAASVEPGAAEPANAPVETVEAASVEAAAVEAAAEPAPVEAVVATPDTIAMPSRERDEDIAPDSEVSYIDPRQPSPGLFDAMPEDPAQIAADAAESSQEQATQENRNA